MGADRAFSAVSSDTRTLAPGDLFVALRGPSFDGNDFVGAALGAPAPPARSSMRRSPSPSRRSWCADTQAALERAAHAWRAQFTIPLVGVAGSNGKTTVKEMTAAILGAAGHVPRDARQSQQSHRRAADAAAPRRAHRFAVIEMGANRAGRRRGAGRDRAARPSASSPTPAPSIWKASAVWRARRAPKARWWPGLPPDATAVINADDEFAGLWRGIDARASRDLWPASTRADFTAQRTCAPTSAQTGFITRFTLSTARSASAAIELQIGGHHNVANALAAAAAAAARRRDARACRRRPARRARGAGPAAVQDDRAAAPGSSTIPTTPIRARCAPASRCWRRLDGPQVAGARRHGGARRVHRRERAREIGAFAREHGVERLFAIGALAALAVESFGSRRAVVRRCSGAATRCAARSLRPMCACSSKARA